MIRICGFILCLFLSIYFIPLKTFSAEVLQVRSSSVLQIGDRNRTYTVKLACTDVDSSNEYDAVNLLKSEVKGRKKVNLKPVGSIDGILLSRVILIESQKDIGQILFEEGLATYNC